MFGYYITKERQQYVYTKEMVLKNPDQHIFALLDKNFNFIKHLPVIGNTYWQDPRHPNKTPYLEDMRMVVWNGEIYGSSSIFWQGDKGYIDFGLEV